MNNQRTPRVTLLARAVGAARCRNRCSCSTDPKTGQRTIIRVDCPLHGRPSWMDRPRIPVRCNKGDCPFCDGWIAEGNKPLTIETVASPRALDQIQQTLDLLWSQHPDVSETARMHMGLAATEIGGNIVQHAAGATRCGCPCKPKSAAKMSTSVSSTRAIPPGRSRCGEYALGIRRARARSGPLGRSPR